MLDWFLNLPLLAQVVIIYSLFFAVGCCYFAIAWGEGSPLGTDEDDDE